LERNGHDFYLTFDVSRSRFVGVPLGWRRSAGRRHWKIDGPSSTSAGDKSVDSKKDDGAAMKSTGSGYENKSEVAGGVGKSPGNAATGQSGKSQ
jgi:hypothetical protein